MSEQNDYVTAMRGLYAAARIEFREEAAIILADADDETRRFADSLEKAIGEISPEEAVVALIKFRDERRSPHAR